MGADPGPPFGARPMRSPGAAARHHPLHRRGTVGRAIVVAILVVATAAVPIVQAGSWTQPRGDAAATGFQPDQGPVHPDVAMRVQLNGSMRAESDAPPLILEDRVVFLAREAWDAYDGTYQVYSMDLDTGNVTTVGEIARAANLRIATDGGTVYAAGPFSVKAFPLGPNGSEWTWRWQPRIGDGASSYGCLQMALQEDSLTVLCFEKHIYGADPYETQPAQAGAVAASQATNIMIVARLDAATGEPLWVWDHPNASSPRQGPPATVAFPAGLAVSGGHVVVEALEGTGAGPLAGAWAAGRGAGAEALAGQVRVVVRALDAEEGIPAWDQPWTSPPVNLTLASTYPPPPAEPPVSGDPPRVLLGNPAASDDKVYVKAEGVRALNLGTGEEIWDEAIGKEDTKPGLGGGTGLALADGQVHATTAQTLYGFDTRNHDDRWSKSLPLSADRGFDEAPIVTSETVYAGTFSFEEPDSIYAVSPEDGDVQWRHPLDHNLYSFSVARGLLALTETEFGEETVNTTIVVLGETEASPEPSASVSTAYPDPGETVRVDLSGSGPGLQGPVTRYKAIWGDGNETDWTDDPVLTHAYGEGGDQQARFVVGNDANQTASTAKTFHVGEEPPSEPTLLQQAFAPEHQDMTFGILGLALALGGGLVGVTRRYRKRTQLEEELKVLEEGFEETRSNPGECEAFLETRKARARSLMLDGDLTEEQFGVLERRIEELRQKLRISVLDERFAFLPHGMVQTLERMLADGQINAWERETLTQALEDDEMLTDDQKQKVERLIDRWFERDAGGGEA